MLRDQGMTHLVVLTAAIFCAAVAQARAADDETAQRGDEFFGPVLGAHATEILMTLVDDPAVQMDMGLEKERADKIRHIVASYRSEMLLELRILGLTSPGKEELDSFSHKEKQSKLREINKKRAELEDNLSAKYVPQLKESLSESQIERLQQIDRQFAGSRALALSTEIAKKLDMNIDQRRQIAKLNQEFDRKQREVPGGGLRRRRGETPLDPEAMRERTGKLHELTKERNAKAVEVLSEEQRDKYAILLGKPFDISQVRMGPASRQERADRRAQKNENDKKE